MKSIIWQRPSASHMLYVIMMTGVNLLIMSGPSSVHAIGENTQQAPDDRDQADTFNEEREAASTNKGPSDTVDTDDEEVEAVFHSDEEIFPDGVLQLVLIVKNEASSIEAVLHSSLPHVDSWYIMDTGSTDGTQDVIKTVTAAYDIPGTLEDGEFVDFATTRNIALQRSGNRTMYKLFIDGDWYINNATGLRAFLASQMEPHKQLMKESPSGCAPCLPCFVRQRALSPFRCGSGMCNSCSPTMLYRLVLGSLDYYVPRVIRSTTVYKFTGVVHEVIGPHSALRVPRDTFIIVNATSTNKQQSKDRWFRDEKLLEKELAKDPTDTRSAFYLAQTYELIDKPLKAYHMNIRRANMEGWEQEAFISLLRAGKNALDAGLGFDVAKEAWLNAWDQDPSRCESIYEIARWYKENGEMRKCALYAKAATQCDYPNPQSLFIKGDIYNFDRWDVLGICAWYARDYEVGYAAVLKALEKYPDVRHTQNNIKFYRGHAKGAAAMWQAIKAKQLQKSNATDLHDEL